MIVDLNQVLERIRQNASPEKLGMVLTHVGIVRATSKEGKKVNGLIVEIKREKLSQVVKEIRNREGIEAVEVFVNGGRLKVGEVIMVAAVGGRFRKEVFPALEELVERIKREVIVEKEV
ncbi:molybdenum cofactor biosynthesis protein MoaE [Thermovibrio sp.]